MDENAKFLVSANKQKTLCEYIVQLMRLFVRFRQVVHVNYNHLNHLTKIHNFSCRPIHKPVYTRLSNLIVQLIEAIFVRFR